MLYITAFIMLLLSATQVLSHEMTPTYPELRPSYIDGLYSIRMNIFNRREDVRYYEIGVFDSEWNAIPFAAQEKILKLEYLGKKDFDIYIREMDRDKIVYICTTSKLLKDDVGNTAVNSKICSKIKRD